MKYPSWDGVKDRVKFSLWMVSVVLIGLVVFPFEVKGDAVNYVGGCKHQKENMEEFVGNDKVERHEFINLVGYQGIEPCS